MAIVVRAAARHDLEARHPREPAAYFVRDPVGRSSRRPSRRDSRTQHREPFRAGVLLGAAVRAPPGEQDAESDREAKRQREGGDRNRAARASRRGSGTVGAGGGGAGVVKVRFGGVITVGVAVGS